jgi:hypothetical protein
VKAFEAAAEDKATSEKTWAVSRQKPILLSTYSNAFGDDRPQTPSIKYIGQGKLGGGGLNEKITNHLI